MLTLFTKFEVKTQNDICFSLLAALTLFLISCLIITVLPPKRWWWIIQSKTGPFPNSFSCVYFHVAHNPRRIHEHRVLGSQQLTWVCCCPRSVSCSSGLLRAALLPGPDASQGAVAESHSAGAPPAPLPQALGTPVLHRPPHETLSAPLTAAS